MTEAYFNNIEEVIIQLISSAKSDIKIAVPWFNNKNIFYTLKKLSTSTRITLLISNDKNNYDNGIDFTELINDGVFVYLSRQNKLMHNKYLIIDNSILITGSYNLTYGAEYLNDENIVVIKDESIIINKYINNFEYLINLADRVSDYNHQITRLEDVSCNIFKSINEINPPKKLINETELAILLSKYHNNNDKNMISNLVHTYKCMIEVSENQKLLVATWFSLCFLENNTYQELENMCLKKIELNNLKQNARIIGIDGFKGSFF